jgi:hypothetical protein
MQNNLHKHIETVYYGRQMPVPMDVLLYPKDECNIIIAKLKRMI